MCCYEAKGWNGQIWCGMITVYPVYCAVCLHSWPCQLIKFVITIVSTSPPIMIQLLDTPSDYGTHSDWHWRCTGSSHSMPDVHINTQIMLWLMPISLYYTLYLASNSTGPSPTHCRP